ncbi:4'-phosphopantetheinyl transferase superfamily protein [Streptomyces sp. NPDC020996]|uniref:4'-phosphopantetheinyl transferase family protein n=1 Tax=Streptomyces sp. NPDC020996 TaxID=3154791 RepID=UPI0033D14431
MTSGPALTASALATTARATTAPPAPLAPPAPGVCDLWFLTVRHRPSWIPLLSPRERDRLTVLGATPSGASLVTSRAAQRLVTARYLGVPPETVRPVRRCERCDHPSHGRPRVPGAPFDYSVSHSEEWLLIAVVGSGRVGADLDTVGPHRDVEGLARTALTSAEHRAHLRLPAEARRSAFLTAWARKEAAIKLTGHGLAAPPVLVDVAGPRATAPRVPDRPRSAPWLTDLPAPPGHAAALATSEPLTTLRHRAEALDL